MIRGGEPEEAKLVLAVFFSDRDVMSEAELELRKAFGPTDYRGEEFEFNTTVFYTNEMGSKIIKSIWSFKKLIPRDKLSSIKVFTNDLEKKLPHRDTGGRLVNLDPGYLLESKLVLATTKDFSHRIYLSKGIFAEVTLVYKNKFGYVPMPWTYQDYRRKNVCEDFKKIREIYRQQKTSKSL